MSTHRRGVRPSQWPVRDLLGPENVRARFWDARVGAAAAGLLACGAAVTVVLSSGSRAVSDQPLEAPRSPLAIPAPAPPVPAGPPPVAPPPALPQVAEPRLPARVVAPRPRSARPQHRRAAPRHRTAVPAPSARHVPVREMPRRRTRPSPSRSRRPSTGGRAGRGRTGRSSVGSWYRFSGRRTRPRCWTPRVSTSPATSGAPALGTGRGIATPSSVSTGTTRLVAAGTARRTRTARSWRSASRAGAGRSAVDAVPVRDGRRGRAGRGRPGRAGTGRGPGRACGSPRVGSGRARRRSRP